MASIVNGLFSGRSGISSHGAAIAVVGDNISNASTVGYKSARTEFADLVAGGQAAGRVVGSGSTVKAVSTIFEQGTLEFTSRPLDLAIDGNGFFVVADGAQRFYTRAGNFKVSASGYIVNQDEKAVLGFPANGSGALEQININTVSQSTVKTTSVDITGNLDAGADVLPGGAGDIPVVSNAGAVVSTTTYADLNAVAEFSTVVDMFDSLGAKHSVNIFFFHTASGNYRANAYVDSDDVDPGTPATGLPRLIGSKDLPFGSDGLRTDLPLAAADISTATGIPWINGSDTATVVDITFDPMTSYSASSNIQSISQDGQGIGAVTSINIQKDGKIYAALDNGQSAIIGTLGVVNFSNAEGLIRIGNNLLQQSPQSGEPIVGKPQSGTFGAVQSGSLELSTVDIANEFVKLITLQRGFQANSKIITTINELLGAIIQLA